MKKVLFLCFFFLSACDQQESITADNAKSVSSESVSSKTVAHELRKNTRWYTQTQLALGTKTYQQHCVQCHNQDAIGTVNWKVTQPNGVYPPPPLNGSAHAWHHDMGTLTRTIKNGGIPLGGVMPAFSQKLSAMEISAVIAFFQSYWSDDIYESWIEIGGLEYSEE